LSGILGTLPPVFIEVLSVSTVDAMVVLLPVDFVEIRAWFTYIPFCYRRLRLPYFSIAVHIVGFSLVRP